MQAEQERWLRAGIRAADVGGGVLREWQGRFSVREKSRSNLVTEADEASQAAIVTVLRSEFPEHGFLGEENLEEGTGESECTWIIDPLDGTTNYVHGFPYFAVSIALRVRGELEVGVIYDPNRSETFSVVRGCGVYLNGKRVYASG
ncbi:MAG: Inositol-monophosphatase, partial [Planctomycetota bacterium]